MLLFGTSNFVPLEKYGLFHIGMALGIFITFEVLPFIFTKISKFDVLTLGLSTAGCSFLLSIFSEYGGLSYHIRAIYDFNPLAQWLIIGGLPFLTLILVLICGHMFKEKKLSSKRIIHGLIILSLMVCLGQLRQQYYDYRIEKFEHVEVTNIVFGIYQLNIKDVDTSIAEIAKNNARNLDFFENTIKKSDSPIIMISEGAFIMFDNSTYNESAIWISKFENLAKNHSKFMIIDIFSYYSNDLGQLIKNGSNSLYIFNETGFVARYDKVHLFPQVESPYAMEGTTPPLVIHTKWGKFGFHICYDSMFDLFAYYLGRNGVELLFTPGMDGSKITPTVAHNMALRAIENGMSMVRNNAWAESIISSGTGAPRISLPYAALSSDWNTELNNYDPVAFTSLVPVKSMWVLAPYFTAIFGWLSVILMFCSLFLKEVKNRKL
eukprot:TRINITY_DN2923_c0_g1_i3.p1 TRINITY_DN2923_c0_g1~~TRINITY_DN2923_c0_g1_i3.p1  ORF type:complete len:508 (+),score=98.62 TRINITY_DN2923_c0_g1_i3:221-1525(+)